MTKKPTLVLARQIEGAYVLASKKRFGSQAAADKYRTKNLSRKRGTIYIINENAYRVYPSCAATGVRDLWANKWIKKISKTCNSISPNGSKCTKSNGHKGEHHDYGGAFGAFEVWNYD